ncbi:MAG: dockerin type I repeat-containing protein [Candidatus Zixiibacteriota bacterium]
MYRLLLLVLFVCLFVPQIFAQVNLLGPESVAWDSAYHRYLVSCWASGKIIAIDTTGYKTVFSEGHATAMGNVVVGDLLYSSCGKSVKAFDLETGATVCSVGIGGILQLDGMTADTSGFVYAVESVNGTLFKIDPTDSSYFVLADLPLRTQDIFFDASHHRILAVPWADQAPILSVDPISGTVTQLVVTPFGWMDGVTMDQYGNTYVTCYAAGQVWRYDSTFTNPPMLIADGFNGPAGIDFNRDDLKLAVPEADAYKLTIVSDIGGFGIGEVHYDDVTYGNGNGLIEAGETIELYCEIFNTSYQSITDVEISFAFDDQSLTLSNDIVTIASIPMLGKTDNSSSPLVFTVPDPFNPRIDELVISVSGNGGAKTAQDTAYIHIGRPNILLIDDDNGDNIENYYLQCFDEFRVPCSVWTSPPAVGGVEPDSSDLNKFDIVVWFTGDDRLPFEQRDFDAIQGYLDGGGNLFLTGQGIGAITGLINPTFMADYLHSTEVLADYVPLLAGVDGGTIASSADSMIIYGTSGANNQTNCDHLAVVNGGVPEFTYAGTSNVAGLTYSGTYKLVFFGFGAEAIGIGDPRWINRYEVFRRIFDFFGYTWPADAPEASLLSIAPGDVMSMTDHTPLFSWTYYDEGSNPQQAYQVQVSSDAGFSSIDLWESGTVTSSDASVEYAGTSLSDGQDCFVRVRLSNGLLWSNWESDVFHMNSIPTPSGATPSGGEEFDVNPPLFGVMTMSDAEGSDLTYGFRLYADAELTSLIEELSGFAPGTGDTTFMQATASLTEYATYYWQARCSDVFEDGAWTEATSFYLVPAYICGDCSGDGSCNIGDAVYLVNYIFNGGPAPDPIAAGDTNGDDNCNIGDAVYLINYIFKGGPAPQCD